jgi:hypothetical protein
MAKIKTYEVKRGDGTTVQVTVPPSACRACGGSGCKRCANSNGYEPETFRDFDEIQFPEFAKRLGFEDNSWSNDACARATRPLVPGREITLWVDYDDKAERETGGGKFSVVVESVDADGALTDEREPETVYEGESAAEAEAAIQELIDAAIIAGTEEGRS